MAVPLTLKVFKGDVLVATRDYDRDIIKIGRLSSAHLCLDDEKVSRIHSVIEVAPDGRLSIIDMGSVEGTYVNGKRVNKGAIAVGDEIKVGNTTIKVESTTDAAAPNLHVHDVRQRVHKQRITYAVAGFRLVDDFFHDADQFFDREQVERIGIAESLTTGELVDRGIGVDSQALEAQVV